MVHFVRQFVTIAAMLAFLLQVTCGNALHGLHCSTGECSQCEASCEHSSSTCCHSHPHSHSHGHAHEQHTSHHPTKNPSPTPQKHDASDCAICKLLCQAQSLCTIVTLSSAFGIVHFTDGLAQPNRSLFKPACCRSRAPPCCSLAARD